MPHTLPALTPDQVLSLKQKLAKQPPFALLPESALDQWFAQVAILNFSPGETILSNNSLSSRLLLVIRGEVRLLGQSIGNDQPLSLGRRGPGQLLGWSSLMRGGACEASIASTDVRLLAFPSSLFINAYRDLPAFADHFSRLTSLQESHTVAVAAAQQAPQLSANWQKRLQDVASQAVVCTLVPGEAFAPAPQHVQLVWCLSTPDVPGWPVGCAVPAGSVLPPRPGFQLPLRLIGFQPLLQVQDSTPSSALGPADVALQSDSALILPSTTLEDLGIVEAESLGDEDTYPSLRGESPLDQALAVTEMVALYLQVPFRRDAIKAVISEHFRRDKGLAVELLAGLCELLGLQTQLSEVSSDLLVQVEAPSIWLLDGVPVVHYHTRGRMLLLGHPSRGLIRVDVAEIQQQLPERLLLALPRRVATTPQKTFGLSWFVPLLRKYRGSLLMVFAASFMAQMFALGIPLLLQQIIDKVLSQGNLSSLNILGAAMLVMALFRGLLQALRNYILVDTTDRMDLTLGSAVINRMLGLPIRFFEGRPVGELSQRFGELNTIRGFLTGTTLVIGLNLIFAVVYIAVMVVYSPLLTAVQLSILPIYLGMILLSAPIYRSLIRSQAEAQAKTQSHLIEVLNGIQTVKAQHFELMARWKWQERYRTAVEKGFKSVALATGVNETGSFLEQLSSLMVLWVGMGLVLKGEFTLGQLIAFRIIAGNVTGPLLQLSGLYQTVQTVQLSFERLSDILNQPSENFRAEAGGMQISLPPIQGAVRFEEVSFRFASRGPYQVDDVSLDIPAGSFVGIVGQSGSGKSTLMKLLPLLYPCDKGRIFIDDYDISKVDLSSLRRQVGIVPQDSLLFEGTIAENIALNDPQATDQAIIEAARIACAHDFIMGLGEGYGTQLAERGSNLSGGQRQRIAIARTILANPRLLVMDEATSALDFNTERQLCSNLQRWAAGRTVFFITHRLSTIRNSDLIVVMHQGHLEESGSHEQLIDLNGRYAVLFHQQDHSD